MYRSKLCMHTLAYKNFILAMMRKPVTAKELVEITGVNRETLRRWLFVLANKPNLIYVAEYKRETVTGIYSKAWAWGLMEEDVPKPRKLTARDYHRRYEEKKKRLGLKRLTPTGVINVSDTESIE